MLSLSVVLFIILLVLIAVIVVLLLVNKKKSKEINKLITEKTSVENVCMQANDALFVINIISGKILRVNESAANMLGYAITELEKTDIFSIIRKEDLEKSSELFADVWEKGGMVFQDVPFVTADNILIDVECSGRILPLNNEPIIVLYARDIRERLRMEHEIQNQKKQIEEKNREITDSIKYAKRIQQALLPDEEEIKKILPNHFIFYKPKDIVSGDFYFIEPIKTNDKVSLIGVAVADCTGHGVPGAFMSMLGQSILKQSLTEPAVNSPADALNYLNNKITSVLRYKEKNTNIRDGMDATFCVINLVNYQLQFSGANNPIYIISNSELIELKGNKLSIGQSEDNLFLSQCVQLKKNDSVYLFSDGFADQFGGPKGKKFKYAQLKNLLLSISSLSANEQLQKITEVFNSWKGDLEQVDDICVIGFRI
jgi:PAS domain S-box-containing protein